MSSTKTKTDRIMQNLLSVYDSQGFAASETISNGPLYLFKVLITNSNASARFAHFFNSTSASGTAAFAPIAIAGSGFVVVDLAAIVGMNGLPFPTACTWAASTTATFSQAGSDLWVSAFHSY